MPTIREIAETIGAELADDGELSRTLGVDEASHIRDEIFETLAREDSGESVEDQLIAILVSREPTRVRLDALLPDSLAAGERGYAPMPGKYPEPPDTEVYVCPQGDYAWPRFSAGEPVPVCPTHQVPLVRSDS
ncbi:hypothetical protein [Mycobacterium sp. 1081908.1]|uniref:hypothetical protein n=1 Tax=Mycobacterium sp. 1081908.1 TaxID=1834066 RepID=UPI0007FDA626|nr:hypothetical protein [Mycobacterium sp. 1081908.1]OBK44799.1 hypothetical protein A5655_13505 [Mycobacterium sp. 1081908.1]